MSSHSQNIADKILIERSSQNPVFRKRRNLIVTAFAVRLFLIGVEYSVIFPSAWLYLKSLNAPFWYLGIVVGSMHVTAIFTIPLTGQIFNRRKRVREILLVTNLFAIVGNIIYALHFSIYLPLIGRILAGISESFIVVYVTETSFIFVPDERRKIYAIAESLRVFGATLAPTFNFGFEKFNIWIGKWHLNYGTSPAVFVAMAWICLEIYCYFAVHNLSEEMKNGLYLKHQNLEEYELLISEVEIKDDDADINNSDEKSITILDALKSLQNPVYVWLFIVQGFLLFSQSAGNPIGTLYAKEMLNQGEWLLSVCYMAASLSVIASMITITMLMKRVTDITIIYVSLYGNIFVMLIIYAMHYARNNHRLGLPLLVLGIVVIGYFIPFNLVGCKSLFTKITPAKYLNTTISAFTSSIKVWVTLGPVFGAGLFYHLDVMAITMITISLMLLAATKWITKDVVKIIESKGEN